MEKKKLLEAVQFELLLLGDSNACQILAHVVALVTLKLNDLSILWVLHHGAVAGELLKEQRSRLVPFTVEGD